MCFIHLHMAFTCSVPLSWVAPRIRVQSGGTPLPINKHSIQSLAVAPPHEQGRYISRGYHQH